MAVEISSIKDVKLQELANQADKNQDKNLSSDEYSVFAQNAIKNGATYQEVSEALDMNAFERWYFDVDKVCTDGKDDGKLSMGEIAESSAKGFFGGILKGMAKNPITTALTLVGGAALTAVTGGAALPVLVALGAGVSAVSLGTNVYKYAKADNDYDAKMALEGAGTSTAGLALAATGVKIANKNAADAGVKSLQGLENASWWENTTAMFKAVPESVKQSGLNIKGNYLTILNAFKGDNIIDANSKQLQGSEPYMSKANDVDAYKFNPNGTPEEIIANNPNVRQVNGKFGVVDKWATEGLRDAMKAGKTEAEAIKALNLDPSRVSRGEVYHIVDPSKTQMIMQYGEGDFAICEGGVFKGSYVDQATFKADGALNYQDPAKLAYGQKISVTKQAPGSFKVMPVGTKVKTLEGIATVEKGDVVALDHNGNPYVVPASVILKRNTGLSDKAITTLEEVKNNK